MKMYAWAILILVPLIAMGCATRLPTPSGVPEISQGDYDNLIEKKSQKLEIYEGLYNKLTVQAAWIDTQVREATLSHSARLLQWDEQKYREEKTKVQSRQTESTEFFLSFYAPERKHNDLSQNKTLWKIFLDVNGQRYEGKATKVKLLLSEIQSLYPFHNRWSTPYMISFPVATSLVENKNATLILTGPVATATLKFDSPK